MLETFSVASSCCCSGLQTYWLETRLYVAATEGPSVLWE